MGKKVSIGLFRINKFNNYKNKWVFNNKLQFNLNLIYYYNIYKFFNNKLLNIQSFYYNNIYKLYGKINYKQINYKLFNKFFNNKHINSILFIKLYKLKPLCLSLQTLKLFIKSNLLKYTSVQNLYNKLYTTLLTEYLHNNNNKVLGIKIIISGRLNNTKLATSEIFQIGFLSPQQLNMFISYDQFCILTKYGLLGIKIWVGINLIK